MTGDDRGFVRDFGLWLGLAVILAGAVLAAQALGYGHVAFWPLLSTWWPLILVAGALDGFLTGLGRGNFKGAAESLLVGVGGGIWAAANAGRLHLVAATRWDVVWALLLVLAGLEMVLSQHGHFGVDADGWHGSHIRWRHDDHDYQGDWRRDRAERRRWGSEWRAWRRAHRPGRSRDDDRGFIVDSRVGGPEGWEFRNRHLSYALGSVSVDLTRARIPDGDSDLAISMGMGSVEVLLPADLAVSVAARVGLGEVTLLGREESGTYRVVTFVSDNLAAAPKRLHLQVQVGMGEVSVVRAG